MGTLSSKLPLLRRIDVFYNSQEDSSTRTFLGGLLTIAYPIVLVAYIVYSYQTLASQYVTTVTSLPLPGAGGPIDTPLFVTVKCVNSLGCFYTENHASVPACQKYTQQWSAFKESIGSCNKLALNATIELPICYNTNYIDGPTFVWDRTGECSGSAPTNVNNNSPVPRDPCFAGLTISMPRLDGGKITNTSFPLFQGIHVLNLVQYSKQDVLEFMTPNSVQVATDSVITKQNLCCNMGPSNINASCDTTSPTSNGIYANDRITFANNSISVTSGQFYQVKIRTGPSYTKIEAKRVPLPLALIAAAGSINSIFLSTCTLVLLAWRFMDFEKRKQTRFTGPAANFGAVAISTVQKPSIAVPSPIKSYEMA